MNWYIALGIKIFASIMLLFQTLTIMGVLGVWCVNWVHDEIDKWLIRIAIIGILLFSITIPIACWIYNL